MPAHLGLEARAWNCLVPLGFSNKGGGACKLKAISLIGKVGEPAIRRFEHLCVSGEWNPGGAAAVPLRGGLSHTSKESAEFSNQSRICLPKSVYPKIITVGGQFVFLYPTYKPRV